MGKKYGKVLRLRKIKINNSQQNNMLVNELNDFEKKKKFKQEKFEEKNDQNEKGKSEEEKSSPKKYIKKTRFNSKNKKKIEKDVTELKKTNESDVQQRSQNNVSKCFEFIVQQYAGPLSVNLINIFSDLFSCTNIKKIYYLLLSAYNSFFSTNKMIASIILFAFEHANELLKNNK